MTDTVNFWTDSTVPSHIETPGTVQVGRVPLWGEVVEVSGGKGGGCYLYVNEVATKLTYNEVAHEVLGFPVTYEVRLTRSDPRLDAPADV